MILQVWGMNTKCDWCQDEKCAVNFKKIYQDCSVGSSHLLSLVKYKKNTNIQKSDNSDHINKYVPARHVIEVYNRSKYPTIKT
jgi:hypothetical protein